MHLLALIKPQFEAPRSIPSAASSGTRRSIRKSATTSRRLRRRLDAQTSRCFRRRLQAVTAISNSSSARAVVERLLIDHVGHRGDGVAIPADRPSMCRIRWAAKRSKSAPSPGHPDRRRLLRSSCKPGTHRAICPHFGVCGGCAIQHWRAEAYRAWKRDIVVETLAQAESTATWIRDRAHGAGRRRITLHARMGTHAMCSRSASPRPISPRHHSGRPLSYSRSGPERRARCGMGAGRSR